MATTETTTPQAEPKSLNWAGHWQAFARAQADAEYHRLMAALVLFHDQARPWHKPDPGLMRLCDTLMGRPAGGQSGVADAQPQGGVLARRCGWIASRSVSAGRRPGR